MLEHEEIFVAHSMAALEADSRGDQSGVARDAVLANQGVAEASVKLTLGDYKGAAQTLSRTSGLLPLEGYVGGVNARWLEGFGLAFDHDIAAARSILAETPPTPASVLAADPSFVRMAIYMATESWPELAAEMDGELAAVQISEPALKDAALRSFVPYRAYALARMGRQAEAQAAIDQLPI